MAAWDGGKNLHVTVIWLSKNTKQAHGPRWDRILTMIRAISSHPNLISQPLVTPPETCQKECKSGYTTRRYPRDTAFHNEINNS
jgi:hypothetical protein